MKILMISETYLPSIGGAEIHVQNLLSKLKESGNEVIFFTNERGEVSENIIRLPWSRKSFFSIFNILWRQSSDVKVIHAHYCHRLAFFAGVIGKLRGIPVVVTLHGMGLLNHPNVSLINQFSHALYRYGSLQLATKVISTSTDLADVAYKYVSPTKVVVILNGYDAVAFNPRAYSESKGTYDTFATKKIILSVRRLVPKNGIQYLVEAIPFLIKKEPNLHYVMVGDGGLRESIKKRIAELGIEEYVTMTGRKANTDVVAYLGQADVVVFPSTAESASIACAEAMGMRKIVVASKVGGLVELIGEKQERGYLVNIVPWQSSNYDAPESLTEESYHKLAECIYEALQITPQNQTKRENAYSFASIHLSWDSISRKTLDVYKSLISKE